jgi:oligosaccharide translocation protein RFT1
MSLTMKGGHIKMNKRKRKKSDRVNVGTRDSAALYGHIGHVKQSQEKFPTILTPLLFALMAIKERTSTLAAASLASVSSLVLLQLFTRVFTFGLNRALVRLASPQTFGTAAIQFELLLSSILFLSREGVRNALLRSPSSPDHQKNAFRDSKTLVSNISLVPVFLGVPVASLASLLYVQSSSSSTYSQPQFLQSVIVYALAAFLELLSEPFYIRAQNDLRFDVRVRAEGTAVMSKTLITFLILAFAPNEWALFAFAAGQAAYGFSLLVVFFRAYPRDISFFPRQVKVTIHGKCVVSFRTSNPSTELSTAPNLCILTNNC